LNYLTTQLLDLAERVGLVGQSLIVTGCCGLVQSRRGPSEQGFGRVA
jgi:hypothetical protein